MPKKYPDYPYLEPVPSGLGDLQIVAIVEDLLARPTWAQAMNGGPLDPLCRELEIDLEYSGIPNEVLLDVPRRGRPVIWLARNSKTRYDRFTVATALGHWVLHVAPNREPEPEHGIQALYEPTEPTARKEAVRFAFELLLPAPVFREMWHGGRAQTISEKVNLPTHLIYDRAKLLMLDG